MSYSAQDIQGAIESLKEFNTQNAAAALTAKSLNGTAINAALDTAGGLVVQKDTAQENLKRDLRIATDAAEKAMNEAYDLLSSNVDMISGALGKKTALAKQCVAIRKKLTKKKKGSGGNGNGGSSSSSSSSNSSSSSSSSGDGGSSSSSS